MIFKIVLFLQQIWRKMEHFNELKATKIFGFAGEFDCQAMMFCFKTRFKTFEKNQVIVSQGDRLEEVVLVLKGSAIAQNIDSLGNISILNELNKGDVYGLEAAYAGQEFYKDSLIASENRCRRHEMVIKNIVTMIAESHVKLLDKLTHMSKKTIRDKLLSYFHMVKEQANSPYFEIPFNKTELASYLAVDRSAMSTELSKMRDEGIIDYDKKQYRLIK